MNANAQAERARLQKQLRVQMAALRRTSAEIDKIDAAVARKQRTQAMLAAKNSSVVYRDGSPKDTPEHREVAQRYAWRAYKSKDRLARPAAGETGRSRLIALVRLKELERLFSIRYGAVLPDDSDGWNALTVAAHHIVHLRSDPDRNILDWLYLWAPWLSSEQAQGVVRSVLAQPLRFKAVTLGERISLTNDERTYLRITTIAACDVSEDERQELRRTRRRLADEKRRRKNGAVSRAEYEVCSLAQTKPWEECHLSRRTWYRYGKPDPEFYWRKVFRKAD